jgi:NADH-quinone oxidoreductase subunit M
MIVMLSSVGLPGLNGFVGEFLILLGAFRSSALDSYWFAVLGASGVILAAVYLLWSYQRMFFGSLDKDENKVLSDLNAREWCVLVPILLFIVWIGFYPGTFLDKSAASTKMLVQQLEKARSGARLGVATEQAAESPNF